MRVSINQIRSTLEGIIRAKSPLTDEQVRWLADDYLEGELQGKLTHGLLAFRDAVPKLADASGEFTIIKETDALLYVDVKSSFGVLVGRPVTDVVAAKAAKQGVAVGLIRDMKSWLRPATFAKQLADHGLVGFVVNTGGLPTVVPPGGRELAIGTNPIGIGLPTTTKPQVVDMATSVRAWGEVRKARQSGQPLPDNAFVDASGHVTTDPQAAYGALPVGGPKGFALGLMIEVLGGALVDMPMGGEVVVSESNLVRNRGAMILALDPAFTVGRDQFATENSEFLDRLRALPSVAGQPPITLPGDRARRNRARVMEVGSIEVDDALWQEITVIASEAKQSHA